MTWRFFRYLLRLLISRSQTRWASIFFTRSCTRTCPYCRAPVGGRKHDLPVGDWFRIVDRIASWGVQEINIVGGEPTLRPELPSLVKHIAAKGILPIVTTNGDRLSEDYLDGLANSGLGILQISLDSLSGFGKSNPRGFEFLQHAATRGILPVVCATASSENSEEIPVLAQIAADKSIMFNCSFYQGIGGQMSVRDPRLDLSKPRAETLVAFLKQFKRQTGLLANHYVYLDNLIKFTFQTPWKCSPEKDYWITVNNDGTLMRCQEHPSSVRVLDMSSLGESRWRSYKRATVRECSGCFWQPYFEKEEALSHRSILLSELRTINAARVVLSTRRSGRRGDSKA